MIGEFCKSSDEVPGEPLERTAPTNGWGVCCVSSTPPNEKPPSACCIAAIHEERVTDHKASTRAAEPEDGCGNLLRFAEAPDWFVLHHFGQGLGITAGHRLHHWRLDRAWANRVYADATGGVFEGGSLGQAEHTVLVSVIGRS